jgi:hypothetical protein
MSRRMVALALLFVGSELVGLAAGRWFFWLFKKNLPERFVSDFGLASAHFAFFVSAAALGLVIFLWALIVAFVARVFAPPVPATPDAGDFPRP